MTRNSLRLGTKNLKFSGHLPSRPSFSGPPCSFRSRYFQKKHPSQIHPHDLDRVFAVNHVAKTPHFEGFQATRDSKTTGPQPTAPNSDSVPPDVCQAAGMPHVHLALEAQGFSRFTDLMRSMIKGTLVFESFLLKDEYG